MCHLAYIRYLKHTIKGDVTFFSQKQPGGQESVFKAKSYVFYSPLILTKNAKCPIIVAIDEFFISGELCIISKAFHEQIRLVVNKILSIY